MAFAGGQIQVTDPFGAIRREQLAKFCACALPDVVAIDNAITASIA